MEDLLIKADVVELIEAKGEKYEQLVWFARKAPADDPFWDGVPFDIKEGALNSVSRVQEMFPDEVDQLNGDHSNWEHGFNSGMLAAIRWVLHAAYDSEQAEDFFPELDT